MRASLQSLDSSLTVRVLVLELRVHTTAPATLRVTSIHKVFIPYHESDASGSISGVTCQYDEGHTSWLTMTEVLYCPLPAHISWLVR